jgi:hypothetical protein
LVFIGPVAHAEINMGESIEWLTVSRPSIGVVESVGTSRGFLTGRTVLTLKGSPPKEPSFPVGWNVPAERWKKEHQWVVFFDLAGVPSAVYDLTDPWKDGRAAISADLSLLDTREEILAAIDGAMKASGGQTAAQGRVPNIFTKERGFVRLEVPPGTPAYGALWGGSTCYLIVPADKPLKDRLYKDVMSDDVWTRLEAARNLRAFPGADTEKILRALLTDGADTVVTSSSVDAKGVTHSVQQNVFPVRQAAWKSLQAIGVTVPKPEGYRDELEHLYD